jgi:hypothetical protein
MPILVAEIKAGEELGVAALVDQFGDERKRVSIFDCNLVESSVVDAQSERAVPLFSEEDWGGSRRLGVADEAFAQVVFDIFVQYLQFRRRETVIVAREWGRRSFLEGNCVVVATVLGEVFGFSLAEYICKLGMVFFWDKAQVGVGLVYLFCGQLGDGDLKDLDFRLFEEHLECDCVDHRYRRS